ncbi:hypothetical protein SBA6_590089 [Candidatus Sulfopaludibacter sp. SbA6]|nr:hypothetical protein SBA6_590089 [Candidatus Sulfopaludibacter sp. SbA6]
MTGSFGAFKNSSLAGVPPEPGSDQSRNGKRFSNLENLNESLNTR